MRQQRSCVCLSFDIEIFALDKHHNTAPFPALLERKRKELLHNEENSC